MKYLFFSLFLLTSCADEELLCNSPPTHGLSGSPVDIPEFLENQIYQEPPSISVSGRQIVIECTFVWQDFIEEVCLKKDGQQIDIVATPRVCQVGETCDFFYVTRYTGHFTLAPGKYEINVDCDKVGDFIPPEIFHITIQ